MTVEFHFCTIYFVVMITDCSKLCHANKGCLSGIKSIPRGAFDFPPKLLLPAQDNCSILQINNIWYLVCRLYNLENFDLIIQSPAVNLFFAFDTNHLLSLEKVYLTIARQMQIINQDNLQVSGYISTNDYPFRVKSIWFSPPNNCPVSGGRILISVEVGRFRTPIL